VAHNSDNCSYVDGRLELQPSGLRRLVDQLSDDWWQLRSYAATSPFAVFVGVAAVGFAVGFALHRVEHARD
jgi:hypothetical protein